MLHAATALKSNSSETFSVKALASRAGHEKQLPQRPHKTPIRVGRSDSDAIPDASTETGSGFFDLTPAASGSGFEVMDDRVSQSPSQHEALDSRDIAALYERHAPAIYAHCRRLLGSASAGRDALQESFVRVLQHHRVLGPGDQALRYLYRTSTNVCINLLRQRSVRERAAPLIAARINAAQSNQPVPGDREFVRMLLEQCDETGVAVALMHFVDGMTQVEVASTLGITRRTVYNRIRRIERLAADLLEPNPPTAEPIQQFAR